MLKNIFIPERIGSYYLFKERALGLIIKPSKISLIKLTWQGKTCIIEDFSTFSELPKLEKYNALRLGLSNEDVIFKEITLPFLDNDKIKAVLPFELESNLPFSITTAYIDFIVTEQDKANKSSTIIAVITKESEVSYLLKQVESAGANNTIVTVNAISTYCLYKKLDLKQAAILIEIANSTITISYIDTKQKLRLIRTISKGINTEEYFSLTNKWLTDEILFTISSFKSQLLEFDNPEKIFLVWNRPVINGLHNQIEINTQIKTEEFPISKIKDFKDIKEKSHITQENLLTFATAYTTEQNLEFNLFQKETRLSTKQFIYKIIPSLTIIFLLFAGLIFYRRYKINTIETQIKQSKQQVTSKLERVFSITDKKTLRNLSSLTKAANNIVSEEENLWFSFSKNVRFSYLRYLEELSKIINREELGLTINKLTIVDNVITIQGEVPSFPQLESLEKSLENSSLFSHVQKSEQLKFTIKVTLKKNNEDEE